METQLLSVVPLLAPLAFAIMALASWFQKGSHPSLMKKGTTITALMSITLAAFSGFLLLNYGMLETATLGINGLGLSIRLDSLSVLMFGMISLLAFIIIKFSCNYLDGDQRQGIFLGRMAATVASVMLLVLAGNILLLFIAWVCTSLSLHRLLLFYSDRPRAVVAARKKFIVARIGDLCLLIAISLLYVQFQTGNLQMIFDGVQNLHSIGSFPLILGACSTFHCSGCHLQICTISNTRMAHRSDGNTYSCFCTASCWAFECWPFPCHPNGFCDGRHNL